MVRHAGTGDEVQPPTVVGGILPPMADLTELVGRREPDLREHRIRALRDAVGHCPNQITEPALLDCGDHQFVGGPIYFYRLRDFIQKFIDYS